MEKFYEVSNRFFFWLLLAVPLAVIAPWLPIPGTATFFIAAVAIIPLAKYIGEATEELAARTNPALGGILNAAFGNAPGLIIGFFALQAGLVVLVKATITGAIIGNLLLVLGVAMFVGGRKRDKQSFNRTAVLASGSTLFLATIALVVPALFLSTEPQISQTVVENLSILVSGLLIVVYVMSLFFSLRTHNHLYLQEIGKYEARWSVPRSIGVLFLSTLGVLFVSRVLVASVEPLVNGWGWSELFIGVVVIAIIDNVTEHFSSVLVAYRDRMDLSLQIAIGSATQTAMVLAPLLVFLSLVLLQPMNLVFDTFELIAIVLSVLIVNLVIADGESNWFEGVQLLAAYAIIAIAFFFHP